MMATSSIDDFLAASLRALRASEMAVWALPSSTSWDEVWERIEFHGIPFLLHSKAHQLQNWPPELLDRLAEEARLVILWETTHHTVVSELVRELDAAGIASVMMKGTALAYSLYDEPAIRRRGDSDLLIQPKDKARTRAIIERLGWYRRDDAHGLYYQEGWQHDAAGFFVHLVDLHWEPTDRPALQALLPLDAFFSTRQAMPRFGPGAYRPEPALMVVHAMLNQKWHAVHGYNAEGGRLSSPRRLIWSVDIDLLLCDMSERDLDRLCEHCERHGVGPLVSETLRGMRTDLRTALPDDMLTRLDAHPLDEKLAGYFANPDSLTQFWIDLRTARSLGEKWRLLAMRAFPPRDHLIEKYPSAKAWPTVVLQGRLMVETAGRAFKKAVS